MNARILYSCAIFLIVACERSESPVPLANPEPAVVPAEAVASKLDDAPPEQAQASVQAPPAPVVGDAVLSIVPGQFSACQSSNGAVVARARWNVASLGVAQVSIFVESPGNPRKLWVNGGAEGESMTGPWVYDQTRFSMTQSDTGRLLAERTVTAVPCD